MKTPIPLHLQFAAFAAFAFVIVPLCAQEAAKPKPEDTEVWTPVPKIVTPGATSDAAPSDAAG